MTPEANCSSTCDETWDVSVALVAIYSVVLLCGTVTLVLMAHMMMRSNTMSNTSISVLNLIFAHFLFIFTVPYRIYYYALGQWDLSPIWCKVVSSMIHIHMYMSFIFYIIILSSRLYKFHSNREVPSHRLLLIVVSGLVWIIVLVLVPCIIYYVYGKNKDEIVDSTTCFDFGKSIKSALGFNYFVSALIIVAATVLTALQAYVVWILYRRHGKKCTSQNDFWAQLKSLCIALIMLVCFVPYHIFRMNYLRNIDALECKNELFLSLTTFNCLDMLLLLRKRNCTLCFRENV